MKIVQCPDRYTATSNSMSLFLAGGITGTGDWQAAAIDDFKWHLDHYKSNQDWCLINPRRETFDITDPSMSDFQITWEHQHLDMADAALFWFTPETMCPITLYELGKWSMTNKPLFIGCDPNYQRKFDVYKQTSLIRPDAPTVSSVPSLVNYACQWFTGGAEYVVVYDLYDHFLQAVPAQYSNYLSDKIYSQSGHFINDYGQIFVVIRIQGNIQERVPFGPQFTSFASTIIDITRRKVVKTRCPDTTYNQLAELCFREPLPLAIQIPSC